MKQMLVKWLRRDCRIEEMYEGSAVDLMALAADEIERLTDERNTALGWIETWLQVNEGPTASERELLQLLIDRRRRPVDSAAAEHEKT